MQTLVRNHDIIDAVLEDWREALGPDLDAYRGHVYRMFNFCRALHPAPEDAHAMAIAAVFHDLGIWSDHTFDYLAPSAERAATYLDAHAPDAPRADIAAMIVLHHKLTTCPPAVGPLAEVFRRADLVDVSLGLIRFGLPRAFVREVRTTFPNAGFHWRLVEIGTAWFLRHPLRPLPMLKL